MSFISYYPTYEILDSLYNGKDVLFIYIDLQNCLTGLYKEDTTKLLLSQSFKNKPSQLVLLSWLDYIEFFYKYSIKRSKKVVLFFYWDKGDSQYHKQIYNNYKSKRMINKYKIAPFLQDETIEKIIDINLENIYRTAFLMPNIYAIKLDYIESDFVPHYLIQQFNTNDISHAIFSRDSDMLQTLKFKNTSQFVKNKTSRVLNADNWYTYLKIDKPLDINYYVYMKAIVGDKTDDIDGVKNVGFKALAKLIKNKNIPVCDSIDEFINYFETIKSKVAQRIVENKDLIQRNFKLVSFDEIIKHMNILTRNSIKRALDETRKATISDAITAIQAIRSRF